MHNNNQHNSDLQCIGNSILARLNHYSHRRACEVQRNGGRSGGVVVCRGSPLKINFRLLKSIDKNNTVYHTPYTLTTTVNTLFINCDISVCIHAGRYPIHITVLYLVWWSVPMNVTGQPLRVFSTSLYVGVQ